MAGRMVGRPATDGLSAGLALSRIDTMANCIIDCSSSKPWKQDTWLDCFAPAPSRSSADPALTAANQTQVHQHEMCELLSKGHRAFEVVRSHTLRHKVAILPQPDVLVGPNAQPLIPVVVLDSVLAQELIAERKLNKQAQLKLGNDAKEIVYNKQHRRLVFDLRYSATDDWTPIRRLLQHNARHCTPSDWQRLHLPPGAHTLDSSPWYASYLTPMSLEELTAIINAPEHTATAASPGSTAPTGPTAPIAPAAPPLLDGFTDEELQRVLPPFLPLVGIVLKRSEAVSEDQAGAFEGRDTLERWRDAAEKVIGRAVNPGPLFPVGTCSGPQYDEARLAVARYWNTAQRALQEVTEAAQAKARAAIRKQGAAAEAVRAACNTLMLQADALDQAVAREAVANKAAKKDHSPRMQKAAAAASAATGAQMVKVEEAEAGLTAARSALIIADDKVTLRTQAAEQKSGEFTKLMRAITTALLLPVPAAWAPVPAAPGLPDADLALPPPEPMWGPIMSMPPRRQ